MERPVTKVSSSRSIRLTRLEGCKEKGRLADRRQSIAGRPDIYHCPEICYPGQSGAIIGDLTSSATLEGGPIAQAAKIPMVSPLATNPKVTEIGDYIFRVCFIDEFQGRVMARFALENLKAKKAAILTDTKQDYSVGLSGFFKETFLGGRGRVVREQSYSSGDTEFRAQLTSIQAAGPEVVFLPGYYPEVGIILKQARQLGITVPFIGCEAWDSPTLLQVAGKAADGCYFSNQFSAGDPSPVVQEFAKVYREKFGSLPDNFAALGI